MSNFEDPHHQEKKKKNKQKKKKQKPVTTDSMNCKRPVPGFGRNGSALSAHTNPSKR